MPLIALVGPKFLHLQYPTVERGGGGRFEHLHLAEVVPKYLVTFYDMCSESSGIFYYPYMRGDNKSKSFYSCRHFGVFGEVSEKMK